jgi:HopA1 effector protein family
MSDRYEAQVVATLEAVGVRPPAAFVWFGRRFEPVGAQSLPAAIQARLLADFYAPGAPRPALRDVPAPPAGGGAFVRMLSQANCGRGSWQPGWRVAAVEPDAIAVARPDGLVLRAPAEECRVDGAVVKVRIPKDLAGLSPGVLLVLGDSPARPADGGLIRLCCKVAAAGAVTLVARVTYALNGAGLPFTLELLADPAHYERRPAADLLLSRADFAAAIALLRPLLRALGPHLSDGEPALAKRLARGLAVAEEPAGGERFGEHRCRLLAEAIVTANERKLVSLDDRLAAVRERFAAAGVSLAAPYLQPGSVDAYDNS